MFENILSGLPSFYGRLHPLLVHFPIGLLVLAVVLELYRSLKKTDQYKSTISLLLYLGTFSAVIATSMGIVLMNTEDYSGELVDKHLYSGIATCIIFLFLSGIRYKESLGKVFTGLSLVSLVAITITGHLGAELTHGEAYLTEVFKEKKTTNKELAGLLKEISNPTEGKLTAMQLERLSTSTKAIFAHNCYQCHNENKVKGGLVLDSKEGVFTGGESGPVIVEGSPAESELYRRVTLPSDHDDVMPKKGKKLKDDEIAIIKKWIEEGAYYNDQEVNVFPEAELALSMPEIPESEMNNPIDKLIERYFKTNDSEFPEVVNDRIFLRRVYLDVIGLLPTPEETDAFLNNSNPKKRANLVEELLDREEDYTLHWLSFWNDLLRNDYSGTGFITGGRRQVSTWLYNSLKTNKPYDSMVMELVNPTSESEGFIRGIKWRGAVNSSQTTVMQAAQNIGQSLLGVNVKCASCHNSFVSNLKLKETYAFASIFADSTLEIYRCDKPTGKMSEVGFLYPELGTVEGNTIEERLKSLSQIIIKPENGRLYRTFVNRIWGKMMGRGIIARYDEMDNKPWNQELLDFLAADFRDNGSDIKALITLIATSNAYQLPSVGYEKAETIIEDDYIFKGPLKKRLTAEQFADAISQNFYPLYATLGFDPYNFSNPANWIWKGEIEFERRVHPKPATVYFRHKFEAENEAQAQFLITVDNEYELFINGRSIKEDNDWRTVEGGKVQLNKGENIIAVKGKNTGKIPKPAGLLFALKYTRENGQDTLISSSGNWVCTKEAEGDWKQAEYDDSEWEKAWNQRRSYWGILPGFNFEQMESLPFVRASLVKLDPFLKSLGRPTREIVMTTRNSETTLLQALELTNGEFLYEILNKGSEELVNDNEEKEVIEYVYKSLLAREPTDEELDIVMENIDKDTLKEDVRDFIWASLMLPEFQFIN